MNPTLIFRLFLCVNFLVITVSAIAQNWPQQNGNPGLTSHIDDIINLPLEEVNRISTTGSVSKYSYANGVIYAWTNDSVGVLCAVDIDAGMEKWCRNVAGVSTSPNSIPAIQDSIVVVGGQLGVGIEALHAENGNTIWSRDIGDLLHRSPVIDGDRIYVQGDSIYCLDLQSGVTVWHIEHKGSRCTPTFDDKLVYFTGFDSLYAVDKLSGKVAWQHSRLGSLFPSLALRDSLVFLGTSGQFEMRGSADGDLVWSVNFPNRSANLALNAFAISKEVLVVKTTDANADSIFLSGLEVGTGDLLWDQYVGENAFNCPTVVGDLVFDGDRSGELSIFNLQTGELLDSIKTSFGLRGQPIYADGMIWVGVSRSLVGIGEALSSNVIKRGTSNVKLQVYPNPVTEQANITIETDFPQEVSLSLYDTEGRKIEQLLDGFKISGRHLINWFRRDLPNGVYILRMQVGKTIRFRKIIVD